MIEYSILGEVFIKTLHLHWKSCSLFCLL